MNTETIIWGLIPAILAIASVVFSILMLWRDRTKKQAIAAFLVIGLSAWALAVFYAIFVNGAWPTILGHIAAGLAFFICIIQLILIPKKIKTKPSKSPANACGCHAGRFAPIAPSTRVGSSVKLGKNQ